MSVQLEINTWINFVLYAVIGRMAQADSVMKKFGPFVRRQAKRQAEFQPVESKPLYRGILLDNGRPVSQHESVEVGGGVLMVGKSPPGGSMIGDDGCVPHALDAMTFVSHTEDLECAQWFASPDTVMGAFVSSLHPGARGYIVRMEKPSTPVLWHHSWMETRMPDGSGWIPLAAACLEHPELRQCADQFQWNAKTQTETILEPYPERLKIDDVGDLDVRTLDKRFCHPSFLNQEA